MNIYIKKPQPADPEKGAAMPWLWLQSWTTYAVGYGNPHGNLPRSRNREKAQKSITHSLCHNI